MKEDDMYYIEWVSLKTGAAGRGQPMPWASALAWYESAEAKWKGTLHHRIVPAR